MTCQYTPKNVVIEDNCTWLKWTYILISSNDQEYNGTGDRTLTGDEAVGSLLDSNLIPDGKRTPGKTGSNQADRIKTGLGNPFAKDDFADVAEALAKVAAEQEPWRAFLNNLVNMR